MNKRAITDNILLSIVVPVYNEYMSIDIFINAIRFVMASVEIRYEIIFVDDGSVDSTFDYLDSLSKNDMSIVVLKLSRNFGKEAALAAGIDCARGNLVVPMDVDLQDDPNLLPIFIERWIDGYDVVIGLRRSREADSWIRRAAAKFFYFVFNRLSGVKLHPRAGDYRLMDRKVIDAIKVLNEKNIFMKGVFSWVGFRVDYVEYDRGERIKGTSKWNGWSLWNFALDGLFAFSTVPIRVWTYVGLVVCSTSFLFLSFVIVKSILYDEEPQGYPSLLTAVIFVGGVQILSIGIIGEYIARIYVEVKGRPRYIIDETRNFRK